MNKKHFVIYYNENKILTETTPKNWARDNQVKFTNFDFSTNETTPTTEHINSYLINNQGFTRIEDEAKVICFKLL